MSVQFLEMTNKLSHSATGSVLYRKRFKLTYNVSSILSLDHSLYITQHLLLHFNGFIGEFLQKSLKSVRLPVLQWLYPQVDHRTRLGWELAEILAVMVFVPCLQKVLFSLVAGLKTGFKGGPSDASTAPSLFMLYQLYHLFSPV